MRVVKVKASPEAAVNPYNNSRAVHDSASAMSLSLRHPSAAIHRPREPATGKHRQLIPQRIAVTIMVDT